MVSDTTLILGNDGALPRLDETLSAPTGETRAKTNVGKAKLLAMLLMGIVIALIGLMAAAKNSSSADDHQGKPQKGPQQASYAVKNSELDNESVAARKAALRKEEDERRAREAAIQAEMAKQVEERQRAEIAQNVATATTAAPIDPLEDPESRKLRTGVLVASASPVGGVGGGTPHSYSGMGAGVSAFDEGGSPDAWKQAEVARRMQAAGVSSDMMGDGGNAAFAAGGGLASKMRTSRLAATAATRLGNLNFILKQGTAIPCALVTGIDTQLPGYISCRVINDIYSANGKTLLVERGATMFGEQQSALMRGQHRTFVVWSRGDNPGGVTFNIDSPGTDSLGYSGIPGKVDRHLLERFGGAILVSLVDDFAKAAAQKLAERRSITIGQSSADAASSLAERTLDESINIPTTLTVKPGTVIYIMAARDVTFEGVYGLAK